MNSTEASSKQGTLPATEAARPVVAVVCGALPPYRLHVHRRIVAEIPEVQLWTIMTHEEDGRWPFTAPPEVNVQSFGPGESSWEQAWLRHAPHEWVKGGRITREMERRHVAAVVLLGYSDLGRLRILRWCQKNRVPCFLWGDSNIRDDNRPGFKGWLKRVMLSRLLRQPTGVLPCGRRGQEYFEKYGVSRQRMFLFPVEPDYRLIEQLTPPQVEEAAVKFSLPRGRRLIYSGRLAGEKRVDLLVRAFIDFAAAAPDRADWSLLILGDGPARAELQALVPEHLKDRIRWLGHVGDPTTIGALYRASDVLVLPSDREPWALVLNEAAAAGLAIISSDVPGAAAELVVDGLNGRIFPAGNQQSLVECLRDVTDPHRIDSMKAASPGVLADWRRRGDPIQGLRQALMSVGVIPAA